MPYVSPYADEIRETLGKGFDAAMEAQPDRAPLVKKLVDTIYEEVVTQLHDSIDLYLGENLRDALCGQAAKIAESMLMNALAGDNAELRNLFGFHDWYMKHARNFDRLPSQWALVDALVQRNPALFVDERIAQRDSEIAMLKAANLRLNERLEYLKNTGREDI